MTDPSDTKPVPVELDCFIESVRASELRASKEYELEAFRVARQLADKLRASGSLNGPEFGRLSRFVDDSLPWDEQLLDAWHRLVAACSASRPTP